MSARRQALFAVAMATVEGLAAAVLAFAGTRALFAVEAAAVPLSATLVPAALFGIGVTVFSLAWALPSVGSRRHREAAPGADTEPGYSGGLSIRAVPPR